MAITSATRCLLPCIAAFGALVVLVACSMPTIPRLTADVPDNLRSAPRDAYPNINLAPDRPGRVRPQGEVRRMESELEELRESHIEEAERAIEASGRSM